MKWMWWITTLAAALFSLSACSDATNNSDAGDGDAGDGEELEGCPLVQSLWNEVWEVEIEESGLEGRTPQTNLMDVWGSSVDNIYAVGSFGSILHYDGTRWTPMESGTEKDLEGVWGFVRKDSDTGEITREEVFAVGSDGTILRYDGTSWQSQLVTSDPDKDNNPDPQPVIDNFHDIWGTPAPGDDPATQHPYLVAVGGNGVIVRFDPATMQFIELRREEQSEYLVRDENGNVIYDGEVPRTAFRTIFVRFTTERLGAVFGSGDTFITVGNNATILENTHGNNPDTWVNEDNWAPPAGYSTAIFDDNLPHFAGVWGEGMSNLYIVGLDGIYLNKRGDTYNLCEKSEDNPNATYSCLEPPNFIRNFWAFSQSHCDDVPDGGTQEEAGSSSWGFFIGWNGALHTFSEGHFCNIEEFITDRRLEGIWGSRPRSTAERTIDGGTGDEMYECDPIEVVITGVDGTIIRLRNREGR